MRTLLCKVLEESMAQDLEVCIYNWTLTTCARDDIPLYWDNPNLRYRYTTKALSVQYNLRHPDNPGLRQRVLDKTVGLKKLVSSRPAELFPELWEPIFEKVAYKQLRKQLTVDAESAPDGMFQCRKCKSKKTTFYQMQTRSADEPMTVFASCLACENRWKQ